MINGIDRNVAVGLLSSEEKRVSGLGRTLAAAVLKTANKDDEEATQVLIQALLRDRQPETRAQSALSLGEIYVNAGNSKSGIRVKQALFKALEQETSTDGSNNASSRKVIGNIAYALCNIDPSLNEIIKKLPVISFSHKGTPVPVESRHYPNSVPVYSSRL